MSDPINPSHYNDNRAHKPIDVMEDWHLNYRMGNALKYISRHGRKPGEDLVENLQKAIWYLEREVKYLQSSEQAKSKISYEDYLEMRANDDDHVWTNR